MRILLVNTNRMQPPIAPIGLDYIGAVLRTAGHEVELADLGLAEAEGDSDALGRSLRSFEYDLVGLSFRNIDDCYYPGRASFVADLKDTVDQIRRASRAQVILGGVGFSIMPDDLLRCVDADGGILGEGEFALRRLADGERDIPGLSWRRGEHWEPRTPGAANTRGRQTPVGRRGPLAC